MVDDTISIFTSTSVYKYEPIKMRAQCRVNKLFAIGMDEKIGFSQLDLLNVKR